MPTIKVSEAMGTTLDWLVAECEGHKPVFTSHWVTPVSEDTPRRVCVLMPSWVQPYEPSRNWAVGGPIIERERIGVHTLHDFWEARGECRNKSIRTVRFMEKWGPTPLIAAMRCYVVSKLGEEVEVPEGLS